MMKCPLCGKTLQRANMSGHWFCGSCGKGPTQPPADPPAASPGEPLDPKRCDRCGGLLALHACIPPLVEEKERLRAVEADMAEARMLLMRAQKFYRSGMRPNARWDDHTEAFLARTERKDER